jgi:glutamate-1-semialdehyde 2,1-aminomutase
MFAGQERISDGLESALREFDLPWSVTRCGARCEMQFMPQLPTTGSEAKAHFDWQLIYYTHLYLANRDVLITPFHNMMLVPPVATDEDIDKLVAVWRDCMAEIADLRGK